MIRRIIAVCTLSLVLASPVQAIIPVTDIANLIEQIYGSYQELQSWMEENELMQQAMNQAGMNTSLEVDTVNNAMANLIIRQGRALEETQNLEVLQNSMPAQDACEAVSASVNVEDVLCSVEDSTQQAARAQVARLNTLEMTEEGQVEQHVRESVKTLIEDCRSLSADSQLSDTACLDTQLLLGGSVPTLSEKEARATEAQIQLIVDPIPERLVNNRQSPDSAMSEAENVIAMRKLGMKALATNSLMRVRAERLSVDGKPSHLQLLREFAQSHFGTAEGADFLAVITNTHGDKTQSVSKQSHPSQVLRSMAVMDAFMAYMEVVKYEQQLRVETLQAALLSATVEPVR